MISDLKVFQKSYDFLLWVKSTTQKFSRVHKYSLGLQLENEVLFLIKKIIKANFLKNKKQTIQECIIHLTTIKVFIRLGKDLGGSKGLSLKQYEYASKQLKEIGNLLGGWYKRFS